MSVVFTIGNYIFDPAPPEITISQQSVKTGAGELINSTFNANINGTLTTLTKTTGGLTNIMELQNEMYAALSECSGCIPMSIVCNSGLLLSANVHVDSLSFQPSSDNWVFTSPFTLSVSWDASEDNIFSESVTCNRCLRSVSESWDITPIDSTFSYTLDCTGLGPEFYQITHTVNAQGVDCCISGVNVKGWETAKGWVVDRLGLDLSTLSCSGVMSFDPNTFEFGNHSRVKSVSVTDGTFGITETWTSLGPSGDVRCQEDYTVECSQNNNDRNTNFNITGTLTGIEKRDVNFIITKTKNQSANECWAIVEPQLINRIQCIASPVCPINPRPAAKSVTFAPSAGTVSYSYSFDNRFTLIPGSLFEDITISDVNPSINVAEVNIIGRSAPLPQPLCGVLQRKRVDLSITVPPTGTCASGDPELLCFDFGLLDLSTRNFPGVIDLLCCIETNLNNANDIVIKTSDTENYNPITGTFSRTVEWAYQNCPPVQPTGIC